MKRNNHACKILENTHYKSERLFTFENYVTKLLEAFEILEDNGMGKNELERVKILLDGIQSDNQTVISAKTMIMMNDAMRTSFQVAVNRLSEFIGATFSGNTSYSGKRAARNVSCIETGCGRGRGHFGRGGRGGQGGRGGNCAGVGSNTMVLTSQTSCGVSQGKNGRNCHLKSSNKSRMQGRPPRMKTRKGKLPQLATVPTMRRTNMSRSNPNSPQTVLPLMATTLAVMPIIPEQSKLDLITITYKTADWRRPEPEELEKSVASRRDQGQEQLHQRINRNEPTIIKQHLIL
jgi:hypothetical protein